MQWRPRKAILRKAVHDKFLNLQKQPPEVFFKKGVPRKFAKFTGKHLCQGLFFNKTAGLWPPTLLKKSLWHRCFPVNFANFLRTLSFTEQLQATASEFVKYFVIFSYSNKTLTFFQTKPC